MAGLFDENPFSVKKYVGSTNEGKPFDAVVVESSARGLWCVREGDNSRQALGPVRNPSREVVRPGPNGTHIHATELIPKGTPVCVVNTASGLWVLAF